MSLLEVFCAVDDFWLDFEPQWKASCLAAGKQRERAGQLCPSEVMTILIHFHQSHYRTFKAYYTHHVQVHLSKEFPAPGELSTLCSAHTDDDASAACLFADLLRGLHRHQLHRLNVVGSL